MTELTATLPLLRLKPAAALDLWGTLIDPAPGMRLESSRITIAVSTSEHEFRDMAAVLACDKLPDALFRIHMYAATFLPEDVPYGIGDLVAVTFGAKPVVRVRGGSEVWATGKLCTLKNAAKRLRSPYWWLRPWNSASLFVVVPSLTIVVLLYWILLTQQKALLFAILPLLFVLLLIVGLGALDAFALRLTQSRITRSSPGAWTREGGHSRHLASVLDHFHDGHRFRCLVLRQTLARIRPVTRRLAPRHAGTKPVQNGPPSNLPETPPLLRLRWMGVFGCSFQGQVRR